MTARTRSRRSGTKAVGLRPVDGGVGVGVQSRSEYVRLSALTWHGRAVHTSAINPRHELVAA